LAQVKKDLHKAQQEGAEHKQATDVFHTVVMIAMISPADHRE